MENPLLVFISSVMDAKIEDLSKERQVAKDAINSLALTRPWRFEDAPAASTSLVASYLRKVDESDIFLVILGSEIKETVQKEWQRAIDQRKPRLVFIKSDLGTKTTRGREAGEFIRQIDVRYKHFTNLKALHDDIVEAVSDELITGYRQYNLAKTDFERLLPNVARIPQGLALRPLEADEVRHVRDILTEIKQWYPDLESWGDKKLGEELQNGKAYVTVADIGGQIAGLAITSEKGNAVRKLSTLYVREAYRRASVGSHLVYGEVLRANREGIRKIQVSFAEERRGDVEPLLSRYGFLHEGISPSRYRQEAAEVVMGKVFVNGRVEEKDFLEFVCKNLFERRGVRIREKDERGFVADWQTDLLGRPSRGDNFTCYVFASTSINPEEEIAFAVQKANKMSKPLVFAAMYGWRCGAPNNVICLDGYDIQTIFFPIEFALRGTRALICSIKPAFASQLIPAFEQKSLLSPSRLQLRTDNVYYRAADRYQNLRRGAPILLYITGESRLVGEALVSEWAVDEPLALFSKYGDLGIYKLSDIEATARSHGGRALAIKFEWFREYKRPLTFNDIRAIVPRFNPITATEIDYNSLKDIRSQAEWK